MRIAYFSPMPPESSGIADYSALLLPALREHVDVSVVRRGAKRPPRGVDLSAYRIVQEGLTNALKHSQASTADVTVRYGLDELGIEVRDNGVGSSTTDGLGHGLVGVRERVKIYGGEMSAGAANGGGFVLSTRLPLGEER